MIQNDPVKMELVNNEATVIANSKACPRSQLLAQEFYAQVQGEFGDY
jgi:hypothetical protein